jgi:hypothetical protein
MMEKPVVLWKQKYLDLADRDLDAAFKLMLVDLGSRYQKPKICRARDERSVSIPDVRKGYVKDRALTVAAAWSVPVKTLKYYLFTNLLEMPLLPHHSTNSRDDRLSVVARDGKTVQEFVLIADRPSPASGTFFQVAKVAL